MSVEKINDDLETTVKGFCNLGNTLNACGSYQIAAVARAKVDKFC